MYKLQNIYFSNSQDPYVNLAFENELLMRIANGESALFMYVNGPSIVYGRFQNPWLECDLSLAKKDKVHIVRRQSGGGCVYHDRGNLNFCFIHGSRDYKKEENNKLLAELLSAFNIVSTLSERSDILIKEDRLYKVSGSAFKQKKDRSFHHCTLLVNSNLEKLNAYLKSPLVHLESKSIRSNPSIVTNLNELNKEISIDSLKEKVVKLFGEKATISELVNLQDTSYYKSLCDWQWIYAETPQFELIYEELELKVIIKKGRIVDFLGYKAEEFKKYLIETDIRRETLNSKIDILKTENILSHSEIHGLFTFLFEELSL